VPRRRRLEEKKSTEQALGVRSRSRRDAARLAARGYDEVTENAANAEDVAAVVARRDDNVYLGGQVGPFDASAPSGPLLRVTYSRRG
jgi:hypothetical protein